MSEQIQWLKKIDSRLDAIEENLTIESKLLKIRENFMLELEEKSGWGKNEIKALYDNVVLRTLLTGNN